MRVQKHPHHLTNANTWRTLADVPAGIVTEEMTDAEFAAWLAEQPPIVTPEPVPDVLPAWRILSVMDLHGYTPTVEAIIETLPEGAKKVAKRQLAGSNIERHHALVLAAQAALGLTDAQVDDLFREADALV
jgi:hypothetical protein